MIFPVILIKILQVLWDFLRMNVTLFCYKPSLLHPSGHYKHGDDTDLNVLFDNGSDRSFDLNSFVPYLNAQIIGVENFVNFV